MKIVYCINSIRETGGAERITVTKANALVKIPGNRVYIVLSEKLYDGSTLGLSPNISLMTLNVNYHNNYDTGLRYLTNLVYKKRQHKKALKKVLCEIQPDIVISVGDEFGFLPSIRRQCRRDANISFAIIRELHHSKVMATRFYSHFWFGKFLEYVRYVYRYGFAACQYDSIIALTQEDKDIYWKNYSNMSVIPNPLTFKTDLISTSESKKVISVGRLIGQKNFASLIRAFSLVVVTHPDWILEIYGEGAQKQMLSDLIGALNMSNNIFLQGETSLVGEKLSEASIFVMSSVEEGLPLVILEAMSCGLPVVAYDCPCGPKDIITDGVDGFLVKLNDEKILADKIVYLIEHLNFRKDMGKAAKKTSGKYEVDKIIPMWMSLFGDLMDKEKRKFQFNGHDEKTI